MRLALSPLVLLAACTGSATAQLELHNDTPVARTQNVLADGTVLRLKMIAVYLSEDVDPTTQNNTGLTSMIWLNDECQGDISGCNSDAFATSGNRVTTFFDLARPSAEVTAELNAQQSPIEPGTYRYARVEMCKAQPGEQAMAPTLAWRAPGMDHEETIATGDCARTSLPFDPPLVLADGDAVSVALGYDLSSAIAVGTSDGRCGLVGHEACFRSCVDLADGQRACMDFPALAPVVSLAD